MQAWMFYKVYDIYMHSMGLDYNQIRHIFAPTASYNYRPNPTVSRTLLQQFDSLDLIDKQNFIRFQFENKWQTKEHDDYGNLITRQIARVIPFIDVDFDSHHTENVGIDIELRPYSWMGIEADVLYDSREKEVDSANFDLYFNRGRWSTTFGQRYTNEESNQTTAEVKFKMNDEWEFKVYERYEFDGGISKEFEATVSKTFECVITDFVYNHHHFDGDAFFFILRLKAFPSFPFTLSQSYSRPKASSASSLNN